MGFGSVDDGISAALFSHGILREVIESCHSHVKCTSNSFVQREIIAVYLFLSTGNSAEK